MENIIVELNLDFKVHFQSTCEFDLLLLRSLELMLSEEIA